MKKSSVLVGYSGHGLVVAEAAIRSGIDLVYYIDKKPSSNNIFSLTYIGHEEDVHFDGWGNGYDFILGIGDNKVRERLGDLLNSRDEKVISVIHPSANISGVTKIERGVFISGNTVVNVLCEIGKYCIINTGAIIEHECLLGQSVHIAPGAVLAGNVKIGHRTFIGANAVVKQGVSIGQDVIVGAGTVVLTDIPDNSVYVGNPAKRIR